VINNANAGTNITLYDSPSGTVIDPEDGTIIDDDYTTVLIKKDIVTPAKIPSVEWTYATDHIKVDYHKPEFGSGLNGKVSAVQVYGT